jgi:predicted nucleic-acid-binding Zn-ribbon protein
MKTTGKCPKCGSTEVYVDACVREQFPVIVVAVRDPHAIFFKREKRAALRAWICTDCGYVELYADKPQTLKQLNTEP